MSSWLGGTSGVHFKFSNDTRPVTLKWVVLGFPFFKGQSEFRFEMNLSYKLPRIITDYAENKPTLIFCNSRKAVVYTCTTLMKDFKISLSEDHKFQLMTAAANITDAKLRGCVERVCTIVLYKCGYVL